MTNEQSNNTYEQFLELISENHRNDLPYIRIAKITLQNFKSVTNGEISLLEDKTVIPYGLKSNILGIYGQNGSGKTSVIEALSILKHALMGNPIPAFYSDCIKIDSVCEKSRLAFSFELQYRDGRIRTVDYSFSLSKRRVDDTSDEDPSSEEQLLKLRRDSSIEIYDEVLAISGDFDGKKIKRQEFINTSSQDGPFGPSSKIKYLLSGKKSIEEARFLRKWTRSNRQSFIFYIKSLQLFRASTTYSEVLQVLFELSLYGRGYLFVVSAKTTAPIRSNFYLPVLINSVPILFRSDQVTLVREEKVEEVCSFFSTLSSVLCQIVPNLRIEIKDLGSELKSDGNSLHRLTLNAYRKGKDEIEYEMPIAYESDGVRKIISELFLLIRVFNDPAVTVAIDEFDAGVFEYLLGELLQVIESSGKGQFIFTSHNLRPLEVIDKKCICFTTTNPDNAYYRLKGIGKTNNLRDVYYREIMLGGNSEEQLYNETKRHKIILSMKMAKRIVDGNEE